MATPPRKPFASPLAILGLVLAITAIMFVTSRRSAPAGLVPAAERKPAGEMNWTLRDNTPWHLSDRLGKVVLVNYFATWCPPCVREMPDIVKVVDDLGPRGVDAIAISLDENGESVVGPFVAKHDIRFPVALAAGDPRVRHIQSIPVTALIDRQGKLAKIYEGMVDEKTLRTDLTALLAEK